MKAKAFLAAVVAFTLSSAFALSPQERKEILDAARPVASQKAGAPVRIKVDKINVDSNWAILIGEIVSPEGGKLQWNKVDSCDENLDKMLFVVLNKKDNWKVKHINICASEPPYWYLEEFGGFVWPCGVYKDLKAGNNETLEAQCRREKK
jgi:hypothetical protein